MRFFGLFALLTVLMFIPTGPVVSADPTPELTLLDRIGGASADVAAGNGFVYAGDGYGIVTFDSRGAIPVGAGRTLLPAPVRRLHLAGTTLAAVNGGQVTLLDLSDPAQPVIRSSYLGAAWVNDAYVAGDLLALATSAGVEMLDISDLRNPQPLDQLAFEGGAVNVVLDGVRLIAEGGCVVGASIYCITLVNAADPAALVLDGARVQYESLVLNGLFNTRLAVSGDLAVVSGAICCRFAIATGRIAVINLATREVVGGAGWLDEPDPAFNIRPYDVAIVGGAALVTSDAKGLTVFSLSATEPPARLRDVALPLPLIGLAVQGAQGYASLADGGILPINLSDPLQPVSGAPVPLLGPVYGLAPAGADLGDLLTISGFSTQTEITRFRPTPTGGWAADEPLPIPLFSLLTPGPANVHALVSGNTAPYSLRLLDASGDDAPTLGPALEVDTAQTIAFNLPNLYFSASEPGTEESEPVNYLRVARFASGAAPELLNTLTVSEATYALAVADERLYRLSEKRFEVYDLSNAAAPEFLGGVDLPESTFPGATLAVANSVAYIKLNDNNTERLQVIDARDPVNPVLGSVIADNLNISTLLVADERLFVGGELSDLPVPASYRLRQYDLSDPLAPALAGEAALYDSPGRPVPSGVGVAVAAYNSGVIRLALLNERLWAPIVGR